jgi:hypothetical protein
MPTPTLTPTLKDLRIKTGDQTNNQDNKLNRMTDPLTMVTVGTGNRTMTNPDHTLSQKTGNARTKTKIQIQHRNKQQGRRQVQKRRR